MATNRPVHGGTNIAELRSLGLRPEDVLDFSASINPLGAPSGVAHAMLEVDLASYPDTECIRLREALSGELGVPVSHILTGNGSTELIHLTARAYLNQTPVRHEPVEGQVPRQNAVIFSPTFGEFEAACNAQRAIVTRIPASAENGFAWDIERAKSVIAGQKTRLVFLCNPNNPTGKYLSEDEVHNIASALREDSLLLLDEAYLPFVDAPWDSMPLLDLGNVALLRSMTKDYALTALRLGYMLAPPDVVERVRAQQHSWSVNGLAQAAGLAALAAPEHVKNGQRAVQDAKSYLARELKSLGLRCSPSAANFILIEVGDSQQFRSALLTNHAINVRDCASFGLPEYIRVGIRNKADCERLIAAMRKICETNNIDAQN